MVDGKLEQRRGSFVSFGAERLELFRGTWAIVISLGQFYNTRDWKLVDAQTQRTRLRAEVRSENRSD